MDLPADTLEPPGLGEASEESTATPKGKRSKTASDRSWLVNYFNSSTSVPPC